MTDRELLQQALEVIEDAHYNKEHKQDEDMRINVMGALRLRLEQPEEKYQYVTPLLDAFTAEHKVTQPEQKPVAWAYINMHGECEQIGWGTLGDEYLDFTPLYTALPQSQPLTDEQIDYLLHRNTALISGEIGINLVAFARAIEAAHNIKETK